MYGTIFHDDDGCGIGACDQWNDFCFDVCVLVELVICNVVRDDSPLCESVLCGKPLLDCDCETLCFWISDKWMIFFCL